MLVRIITSVSRWKVSITKAGSVVLAMSQELEDIYWLIFSGYCHAFFELGTALATLLFGTDLLLTIDKITHGERVS